MCGADHLVNLAFSGLSPLVIEDVAHEGELLRLSARTPDGPVACPDCGVASSRVHGYGERTLDDVAIDGRRVLLIARIRRLVCPTVGCRRGSGSSFLACLNVISGARHGLPRRSGWWSVS